MTQKLRHRGRRRGLSAGVAALLVAGTMAACGQSTGDQPRSDAELAAAVDCTTAQPILDAGTQPTTAAQPPAAGSVPAGFLPAEVIRCSATLETVEDSAGLWSTVRQEHLAGDMDALVEALAQPSDGLRENEACTADAELVPDLWLLDASGTAMRAAWPTDSCGKTKPGVHEVLAEMDVVESSRHQVALIQPRAALDVGCPAEWHLSTTSRASVLAPGESGDVPGAENGVAVPASPGLLANPDDVEALRICQYRTTPVPAPGVSEGPPADTPSDAWANDAEIVAGTFVRGGELGGAAKDAVLAEAAAGPSAAACSLAASGFVVLWPVAQGEDAGAPLAVELDGCRRLVSIDGAARTAPGDVIAAILLVLEG
ncbi:hypothetical protein ABIB35_003719 [Arthrobacter sp. UYP6]|uniref:hypothetical protein n=1 Tax=Arthrobacter sp. UYP6 TaxID=1756378 RepID=UPI003391454E